MNFRPWWLERHSFQTATGLYTILAVENRFMTDDQWLRLASLFDGLANPNRLATLCGTAAGRDVAGIADSLPVSEQAVRNHAERLVDAELVYRTDGGDRLYQVTPLGRFFAGFVDENRGALLDALDAVGAAESEARDRFAGTGVSDEVLAREVDRLKWELAAEELELEYMNR
jgi:DNA-binding transcriptional ArsR family regulator